MINLQDFCGKDNYTYELSRPFVRDGYIYATDGKIAVRMVSEAGNSAPLSELPKRRFPDAAEVFEKFYRQPDQPWPWLPNEGYTANVITCPECLGSSRAKCEKCGHEVAGHCEECHGLGQIIRDAFVMIGIHKLAAKYDRLIRSLPHPQWQPGKDANSIFSFRFDGGQGVVMPMTQDLAREIALARETADEARISAGRGGGGEG